jgi:hypothetical protein
LDFKLIPLKYRSDTINALNTCKFPKRMHKDYHKFFEALKTEERTITDEEKTALKDAAEIWNFNKNATYQEQYIWATELLK